MKYAYQRDGSPLVNWRGRVAAPMQSRAADSVALGSLGDPTLTLPAPGAPEPLNGISCKCGGSCGCKGTALEGIPVLDQVADAVRPVFGTATSAVVIGGAVYAAYRLFIKKK